MTLPTWTRDAGTMKRDIDEHGYCLVKEALTPEQLAEAQKRLSEQAEAERKADVAFFSDGRIPDDLGEFPEPQYWQQPSCEFFSQTRAVSFASWLRCRTFWTLCTMCSARKSVSKISWRSSFAVAARRRRCTRTNGSSHRPAAMTSRCAPDRSHARILVSP